MKCDFIPNLDILDNIYEFCDQKCNDDENSNRISNLVLSRFLSRLVRPSGPLSVWFVRTIWVVWWIRPFSKDRNIRSNTYIYTNKHKSDMNDKYYNITYQHIACKNTCTRFLQSDHCTRHLVLSIWRNQLSCHGILKDIHTLKY